MLGADVSSIVYVPFSSDTTCDVPSEVHVSIVFPVLSLSTSVAPAISSPVSKSVLLIDTSYFGAGVGVGVGVGTTALV